MNMDGTEVETRSELDNLQDFGGSESHLANLLPPVGLPSVNNQTPT